MQNLFLSQDKKNKSKNYLLQLNEIIAILIYIIKNLDIKKQIEIFYSKINNYNCIHFAAYIHRNINYTRCTINIKGNCLLKKYLVLIKG